MRAVEKYASRRNGLGLLGGLALIADAKEFSGERWLVLATGETGAYLQETDMEGTS